MILCIYALAFRPDRMTRVAGLAGERLHAISVGRVAALVGELPRRPRVGAAALRRYDRVVQSLAQDLPAVLPARLGTCVDPDALALLLRARQQTFRDALRAVRGRAQMTVRVAIGERRSDNAPMAGSPRSGAEYLRARAAAAARAAEVPGFDPVRAAVRRWVRDERVERRGGIASVYHLVPRGAAPAYRSALEAAARGVGLRVHVSGPWPPYAFSNTL